jgi:hypothetical protein
MYYVGGGRWWWKVESIKSASKAFGKVNCLFVPVFFVPTDMSTKACDCFKEVPCW